MKDDAAQRHILPLNLYLAVGSGLLVLTVITVAVAQMDFGQMNLLIAMGIAVVKATLVAMFFMHLKYDNRIYMLVFVGSLLFLGVFIIFTMFDTLRRGDIYEEIAEPYQKEAVIYRTAETGTASSHAAADSSHNAAETETETSDH
ncbi:MAG: cytochrome C oxidase subunit IV family protein [candidate division Zixibacteria bacterium]|nr:cytochrome C oxidase subunit IV family protein [candidate division Zixibacteria bacterium]